MEVAERKRILLAGDVEGSFTKLFGQVENQTKRVGKFDVLFAVGATLPGVGAPKESASQLAEYVSGAKEAPIETYAVDSNSAALITAAPDGKTLCKNVNFLGGFGIREIHGLQVAYLSGHYDRKVFETATGAPFVGACYTANAVEGLKEKAKSLGKKQIDIFLTAEWPLNLEDKLEMSEKPKHPEGLELDLAPSSSPVVADLCVALGPRYHVFGTADIFYHRAPFQTPNHGHVCRCIGLGKVGSRGKGRTWIHALSLQPAAEMPQSALLQRPDTTSPCPFKIAAGRVSGEKRSAESVEAPEPVQDSDNCEVFVGGLPEKADESTLAKAFKRCGTIERIHVARDNAAEGKPCKGFGFVRFATPEEAAAALQLSDSLEVGRGRKLSVRLAVSKGGQGDAKKRCVKIVIEPHADCWFCLVNPKVEKHMIVHATTEIYIAAARGPIHPMHVLLLPVKHAPCYCACPPELQKALKVQVDNIRKLYRSHGCELFMFERWTPFGDSARNHMMLQILPVETRFCQDSRSAIENATKRHLPGAKLKRVKSHDEVIDHLNDDSSQAYIYFEMPGDNTAKGRESDRYLYVPVGKEAPRVPLNFGRAVACELIQSEARADWRECQDERDREKQITQAFRAKLMASMKS